MDGPALQRLRRHRAEDDRHTPLAHDAPSHCGVTCAACSAAQTSPAAREPRRSAEFWLLDGSVVLQVNETVFKVYRSSLTKRSPFLARLFAEAGSPERYKGYPLYKLTNIVLEDFEELLRAEDAGIDIAFRPPLFHALIRLLRAACALDFESWRTFAVKQLITAQAPPVTERISGAVQLLMLSRTFKLPVHAKRALYELMRTPAFGQRSDDAEGGGLYADNHTEALNRLSREDVIMLHCALQKAQLEWLRITHAPPPLDLNALACPSAALSAVRTQAQAAVRDACLVAREKPAGLWTERVTGTPLQAEGLTDPVGALEKLRDLEWGSCTGCSVELRMLWDEERDRMWNKLDDWLDLRC